MIKSNLRNSLSDGQISLWRYQYKRQGNEQSNNNDTSKKWFQNQNRDASSIVSRRRVVQSIAPTTTTQEFPPSCQNFQDVRQALRRVRSHGYRAPIKIGFSPFNTSTFYIGLPEHHYLKFNTDAYLHSIRGNQI